MSNDQQLDVLYVPLATAFGGGERSALELAGEIAALGYRTGMVAEEVLRETPLVERANRFGIELVWTTWGSSRSYPHNLRESVRVFRSRSARIIHFNVGWRRRTWVPPLVARGVTRSKLIGSMRFMPDPHQDVGREKRFGFLPGMQLWNLPAIFNARVWGTTLDLTVSVNKDNYPPRLVEDYGFPSAKLRAIHNGVSVPPSPLGEPARMALRVALGIAPEGRYVCYAGRLASEKGVDVLLRALAAADLEETTLLLVGEGADDDKFRCLCRALGIQDRVRFTGFMPNPEQWMAASDLVVVPSIWQEAFGRVVVESMAEGTPVCASRIGGMTEIFSDGEEGFFVPPGDAVALARLLRDALSDVAGLRAMGHRAHARAKERFTLKRVAKEYLSLYEGLGLSGLGASDRKSDDQTRSMSHQSPDHA